MQQKLKSIAFWIIPVLTFVAFAIMFCALPYMLDDLWYMERFMDYMTGQSSDFPFAAIGETLKFHYLTDNARLGNALFTCLLPLPRFISAIGSLLMLALALYCLIILSGVKGRPLAAVWLCFLFAIFPFWTDGISMLCFQFNYLWASAIALLCLTVFLHDRPLNPFAALILGLIAGAWHEGFSVPLLCALVGLCLFWPRRFLNAWRGAMMLGLLGGICYLLSSPAFFRYSTDGVSVFADPMRWYRTLRLHLPFLVFFLMALIGLAFRTTRHRIWTPTIVAFAIIGVVACVIFAFSPMYLRVGFFAGIIAVPAMMRIWAVYFRQPHTSLAFKASVLTTALAALFLICHYIAADIATLRLRQNIIDIHSECWTTTNDTIFKDLTWGDEVSFLCLGKPFFPYQEECLKRDLEILNRTTGRSVSIVPTELEYVTAESGEPVEGRPGLRVYNNRYFIPATPGNSPYSIRVRYGDNLWKSRAAIQFPFTSRADGKQYYYMVVQEKYPFGRIWPITAIDW